MDAAADMLRAAAARLAAAGIDEPMREARILANAAPDQVAFQSFIVRREKREPVAYILGRREFWSLELEVTPAVLIPRPDTETLVQVALAEFKQAPPARVLDLGTGSGAILIALLKEWPQSTSIGVDKSAAALAVAARNALRHGVADRMDLRESDWSKGIVERFDLVISNPPYIGEDEFTHLDSDVRDHEPHEALLSGPEGLDDIARIAKALPDLMTPHGRVIVEIGYKQAIAASRIFTNSGLEIVKIAKDLAGHDRALVARLPQPAAG
jgi:release factor glutamine methyltransferase